MVVVNCLIALSEGMAQTIENDRSFAGRAERQIGPPQRGLKQRDRGIRRAVVTYYRVPPAGGFKNLHTVVRADSKSEGQPRSSYSRFMTGLATSTIRSTVRRCCPSWHTAEVKRKVLKHRL